MSSGTKITLDGTEFAGVIEGFFAAEFPAAMIVDVGTTLDLTTKALIGTSRLRVGPAPDPESLVAIREVVRDAIEKGTPIPILVPWGSKKPKNHASVDVAEVCAFKQLACIARRVTAHHAPGVDIRVRVEDASGYHMFADDRGARAATERYCADLKSLVRVLGINKFVELVFESSLFDEREFARRTDELIPIMARYISETDEKGLDSREQLESWALLREHGWQGIIPVVQREHYRTAYSKLYPGISKDAATLRLASYLSGSLIRRKLKGSGDHPAWGGKFLQIPFVGPVPGAPAGLTLRNLYYRTVDSKLAATHIPPWRAKGYLKINGREATPKITSWQQDLDFTPCSAVLTNGTDTVDVACDYVVAD